MKAKSIFKNSSNGLVLFHPNLGMKSGITQNSSPTTSSSYETACISNSTSYRIRNEYSANASSNYLEDMYANADLISPSTSYKHNLSSKKHDTYVDEYDNGSMPYDKVISGNTLILPQNSNDFTCAVCGDGHAKLHYGVLACYGCKGFFRRTLTGKYRYACRFGNNCIVDKYQRNSCRYCRFNRCLEVGMDPKAVRPDRDLTGKQRVPRARKRQIDEELISHIIRLQGNDWSRKIPVEAKVLLMQLLNIESKVCKGDAYYNRHHSENNVNNDDNMSVRHLQSKRFDGEQNEKSHLPTAARQSIIVDNCLVTKTISLRELFEQKPSIQCQRTEMCFEPYRMARPDELSRIAYRSALAAVDWIESLSDIGDFSETENKIALIKACYAPLSIFNISARTVQNTKNPDILCLNNHCYVPRKLPFEFSSTTHLSNSLIDRTLNELVSTLRKLDLREEEVVPLKSIIILNPNAKGLSIEAQQHVAELRDRIQDMLFQIVKELHPTMNASARFGNLLLLLPTITTLSGVMNENMQFTQVFGNNSGTEALLNELFEDDTNGNKISMGSPDEPLITSSTSVLTPPLYENPADISLQPLISMRDTLQSDTIEEDVKVDEGTQTELNNFFSIQNEKNLEKGISASFCSPQDLFSNTSKNQIMDETVVDFGPSFDSSSLFDDCELVDSSTFSPEMAAQLFESNDFFEFI